VNLSAKGRVSFLLFIKKKIVRFLGYRPDEIVSLANQEKPAFKHATILGNYAKPQICEVIDPRVAKNRGHFFNNREYLRLNNVILEPRQGLLYSKSGELVLESTNWPSHRLYNSYPWNPKKVNKLERTDDCIFLPSSAYGHWIMEDLPLFLFLIEKFPKSPILVSAKAPKYVFDILRCIQNEVVFIDSAVTVESIIMVAKNEDSGWPHPTDLEVLKSHRLIKERMNHQKPIRKIFASRIGSKRSPGNEFEVQKIFKNMGYECHLLHEQDFLEEINLVSECKVLAGFHGSALSNIIWTAQGTLMVDLVNQNYWTEAGHRLASLTGATYLPFSYSGQLTDNIDLSKLESFIDEFEKIL
jgi:hypothetical protein